MATQDVDAFVILNKGLIVETREGMGNLAVATQSFDRLYQVVLRERPAIVWMSDNFGHFLQQFQVAPTPIQTAILEMYHPPLDHPAVAGLMPGAIDLALSMPGQKAEFIHKLLAIVNTNTHEYYGKNKSSTPGTASMSALFLFGSKMNHSCEPNLTYTSMTDDGALEYKVIRPIQAGEATTFSYIGDLFRTPTPERRKYLQQTKAFFCECQRCTGPDYCRYVKCTQCHRYLVPTTTKEQVTAWMCDDCLVSPPELFKREQELAQRLEKEGEIKGAHQSPEPLKQLAQDSAKVLSPAHHITITALQKLFLLFSSKAYGQQLMQDQQNHLKKMGTKTNTPNLYSLSLTELRQLAAKYGLQAIAHSECVAHGCPGDHISDKNDKIYKHDPVFELAGSMFHVCKQLMELQPDARPEYAVIMVQRYLPILKARFGDDNPKYDVNTIAATILQHKGPPTPPRACDKCGRPESHQNKLQRCSRCQQTWYCNRDCQLNHWKAGHKKICVPANK